MNPNRKIENLLKEVTKLLAGVFKERYDGVILYGSAARNELTVDSDIDILVLLKNPIQGDLRLIIDTIYPLQLEVDHPIHAIPVSTKTFEQADFSLYRNVKREGIRA